MKFGMFAALFFRRVFLCIFLGIVLSVVTLSVPGITGSKFARRCITPGIF